MQKNVWYIGRQYKEIFVNLIDYCKEDRAICRVLHNNENIQVSDDGVVIETLGVTRGKGVIKLNKFTFIPMERVYSIEYSQEIS